MNPVTRHIESIKEKGFELLDDVFSIGGLGLVVAAETVFLLVFIKLHALAHDYLEHSTLCPIKIAIIVMGLCFILLSVEIVIASFITQSVRVFRRVRFVFERSESREKQSGNNKQTPHVPVITNGGASATICVTTMNADLSRRATRGRSSSTGLRACSRNLHAR